ncbi:MAG: GreA/GreB family elongation factor [Myxococcaceae bacterium]|nr:GreA/GreB family elongation factor [Myxococcaceae bacterium]
MSKAFTSEETEDTSVAGRPPKRVARGQERPITPEGHRALVDELEALESTGRAALRAMTVEHEREQAKRQLETRLAMIDATLESVRVVQPPEQDDGVVRFGSVVTLAWADGREQTVRLVGPDEADVKHGKLSIESPLARALLDAKEGSTVEVERPRGVEEATVTRVRSR